MIQLAWLLPLSFALTAPACARSGEDGLLVPETVVDDQGLPRFALGDGRLVHLRTFGEPDDPVLIVLHGGPGGDHRDYLHLESFADAFFVVLFDQRGTGLSERVPDAELDGPTYLEDLDFIGAHFSPDRPFHLLGHSWGGAYATYYVQSFPERVDGLVLVEPGALNGAAAREVNVAAADFGDAGFQEFLNTTDYLLPDGDARADYFYVIALAGLKKEDTFLGYDFWRLGLRANVGINRWQGNFDGSYAFDFTAGLDARTQEVLLIAGTSEGRLGHDFQATHHAPHFPSVRLVHFPDATHSELVRVPESLAEIRAYLEAR